MASERIGAGTVLVAVLAAAVTLALLPGAWPVPTGGARFDAREVLPGLRAAAAAVDAACARGDVCAFAAGTTAAHREALGRQLAPIDAELDGRTLRLLVGTGRAERLRQPVLAGSARGERVAVAVARAGGDGAQLLAFAWNGSRWLLDACFHAPSVNDAAAAAPVVRQLTRPAQRGRIAPPEQPAQPQQRAAATPAGGRR